MVELLEILAERVAFVKLLAHGLLDGQYLLVSGVLERTPAAIVEAVNVPADVDKIFDELLILLNTNYWTWFTVIRKGCLTFPHARCSGDVEDSVLMMFEKNYF